MHPLPDIIARFAIFCKANDVTMPVINMHVTTKPCIIFQIIYGSPQRDMQFRLQMSDS